MLYSTQLYSWVLPTLPWAGMLEEGLYLALLKLVREGQAGLGELEEISSLGGDVLVKLLEGLPLRVEEGVVVVEDVAALLVECWRRGMDPVRLALGAGWRDFERLCARVLEEAGYEAVTNLRFKWRGRRYEIDVAAFRRPRVLAVDCKRWSRLRASSLKRAAEAQKARADALAGALRSTHSLAGRVAGWGEVRVYPVVVSIHEGGLRVYEGVPLVPMLKLPGFLREFEAYEEELYVATR